MRRENERDTFEKISGESYGNCHIILFNCFNVKNDMENLIKILYKKIIVLKVYYIEKS